MSNPGISRNIMGTMKSVHILWRVYLSEAHTGCVQYPSLNAVQTGDRQAMIYLCLGEVHALQDATYPHLFLLSPLMRSHVINFAGEVI